MIPDMAITDAASAGAPRHAAPVGAPHALERPELRQAAEAFEAVFLSEMLSHAGMGAMEGAFGGDDFGGGAGESAFASLLTREWATRLSAEGGVGLADAIYQSLLSRSGADG